MRWASMARKEQGGCWAQGQPHPQHHTIGPAMQPQDAKSLVIKRPLQELEFLLVHMHIFLKHLQEYKHTKSPNSPSTTMSGAKSNNLNY